MDVTFENLKKSYDGKTVLDLHAGRIREGRITALIGPNGAGKSTLLKLIAGIEDADSGSIFYGGEDAFPQEKVTLVFQKPYLFSTTVEKNIAYPLKLRGMDEAQIRRRVSRLAEELKLQEFLGKKAWKLSGGETQKVALARALSFEPELLMLDEPTANIDPHTTAEIEKMLRTIGETGKTTIVIVTHNLAQAKRICDDAVMLHEGRLVESGPCEKLLTEPAEERTRRFIKGELLV